MDWWNWIVQSLHVDSWGITPMSLAAPFGLITLMVMARRLARERGPGTGGEIGGIVFLAAIVGAAFLWIFAGLGLMERTFH